MKVYQALVLCGRLKVRSAEVIGEEADKWCVKSKNDISYFQTAFRKSEVYETPRQAVDALAEQCRRSVDHYLKEVKWAVRDLEKCLQWKEAE